MDLSGIMLLHMGDSLEYVTAYRMRSDGVVSARLTRVNIAGERMRKAICPMFVACGHDQCEFSHPSVTGVYAVVCPASTSPETPFLPESFEYVPWDEREDYVRLVSLDE